jgi:hypothetical protein
MDVDKNTFFVIYNPSNRVYITDYEPYTELVQPGYYMAYWVGEEQQLVYKGSYINCRRILEALTAFGLN